MMILFGLILSEEIRFRRIDGWQKIVDALTLIDYVRYRLQAEKIYEKYIR
jgi:hypothetical protein